MKKGTLILVIYITCLLLSTGCASKSTLKCTKNSNGVDTDFNVYFMGNKIENMDLKYFMDLSSFNDSQIDIMKNQDLCSGLKEDMAEFKESFSNCKQNIEDKKLSITADFDINKISNEKLGKMQNPEAAKTDLEKTGYKCTIEK